MGGSDHILSGGMISTDFFTFLLFLIFRLFFMFFVFLGYYTTFCLVLYVSLSVFWSRTNPEMTGPRIPPPFLVREFSVLTRLKNYSR